jgi:hypothetical protein
LGIITVLRTAVVGFMTAVGHSWIVPGTWVVTLNKMRGIKTAAAVFLAFAGFEVDERPERCILIYGTIARGFGLIRHDDFGVELQEATRRHRDTTRGYFLLQWV